MGVPWLIQENSQNAPLVHATLETLLRFLNWIPLGYIFETKLISTLVYKVYGYDQSVALRAEPRDFANDDGSLQPYQFLNVPMFRNVTLKCLTEIAGVSVSQYEEQFVTLFTLTMCQLKQVSSKPCSLYTGADFFLFSPATKCKNYQYYQCYYTATITFIIAAAQMTITVAINPT